MGVVEFLCDRRFHRLYTLVPSTTTGRTKPFRISYADYGDSTSDAVVLFCGALMGGRMSYSPLDQLAKKYRVRIIHPDRPGVGGTDAVPLTERISLWLELVPQLLSHLNITHVSIASHSGGILYALNTIITYPDLLHPQNPYVCFYASWVHHFHSKVGHLMATELLPAAAIGKFASLAHFVNDNIMPIGGMSSGFVQSMKTSWLWSAPAPTPALHSVTDEEHPSLIALDDPSVVDELRQLIATYVFAETHDGQSADAQLFLKHPQSIAWCSSSIIWSDIDDFVPILSKAIEEDGLSNNGRSWTIDAFHAENDNMVGVRGRKWFDSCWEPGQSPSPLASEATMDNQIQREQAPPKMSYHYRSQVVKGSDHNYLTDPAFGAVQIWLARVRASFLIPSKN